MLQLESAFHAAIDGHSVGKHDLVIRFWRGARRLRPSRPPTVPPCDLVLVLGALVLPPFEPLQTVSLRELLLKTALLLTIASVKRVGDLQALSVNADYMQFGLGDCNATLKPRLGYVPKSPKPFRAQVVALSAFTPELATSLDAAPNQLLCPVRALRVYVNRTAQFRQSKQLFVCFGGSTKVQSVSKQRLSHWVVEAIDLAYSSRGMESYWSYWCPEPIQQGCLPPRGRGLRAVRSKIFVWLLDGLRRISSPDCTIWMCGPHRSCR